MDEDLWFKARQRLFTFSIYEVIFCLSQQPSGVEHFARTFTRISVLRRRDLAKIPLIHLL